MPEIREGFAKKLFKNESHVAAGMTYRSFWIMWEQVERIAAVNYPKYLKTNPEIASTYLEAVVWCRQIANPEMSVEPITSEMAEKVRAKEARKASKVVVKESTVDGQKPSCPQPECGSDDVIRSTVAGQKKWKCRTCLHRWPREAPTGLSEAQEAQPETSDAKGKKGKREKGSKKGKKKKAKH